MHTVGAVADMDFWAIALVPSRTGTWTLGVIQGFLRG